MQIFIDYKALIATPAEPSAPPALHIHTPLPPEVSP